MSYLSLDYLIVYAFLAITLIIGLRAGRGIKDIREYALANKSFGTIALVLTYLATDIGGGSIIGDPKEVFSNGIIMTVALSGFVVSFILRALFIAPKMIYFDGCLTMGDIMGSLYGKLSGVITGILAMFYALAVTGIQLIALGVVCQQLLGIDSTQSVVVGGILMALYSSYGGIKAVTTTDIFQFIVLIIFIPLIAYLVTNRLGGIQEMLTQVPADHFQVFSHKNFSYYLTFFIMWSVFSVEMIDPAIIQRLLMGQNGEQLRNQFLVVAAFDPAFRMVSMLIGLAGLVLYPTIEAKLVVPHIIKEFLPAGLKGLTIAGALAVVMSTTDSYLHATGLAFSRDVLRPIAQRFAVTIDELKWARYGTILMSLAAIAIALQSSNLLNLSFVALSLTGPVITIPLIAGILGLKVDSKSFYTALLITIGTFIISKLLLPQAYSHFTTLISTLVNGISFLAVHLIQNGGFVTVQRAPRQALAQRSSQGSFFSGFFSKLPTPKRILAYSQERVARYGAPYILFGVFFVINYTLPYFLWMQTPPQYTNLMLNLRLIGGVLCVLLIVREKWPSWLLPYMPAFWYLTVLYCLPFTSTVMFLLTHGSTEWLINIAIIIILLFILVDWLSAVFLALAGVVLGGLFHVYFIGTINLPLDFGTKYLLVYQVLFGALIGLIFARRRQIGFNKLAQQRDHLAASQTATSSRLIEAYNYRQEFFKELTAHEGSLFNTATADYIKQAVYRMTDYLRLEVTTFRLDQLLAEITDTLELSPRPFIEKHTQVQEIQADRPKLQKVLMNSLEYLQKHNTSGSSITIGLEDAILGHEVAHIKNHTRKLAALKITLTTEKELPATQAIYMIEPEQSSVWAPKDQDELPLVENACTIDAHYGYIEVKEQTTHVYVIPVKLREVRGKVMELLREPAAADPEELKHPVAIELEKELFSKLKQTPVDLSVIHKALDVIKKYHGGVKRKSGEPFFTHPINVALILLEYSQDQDAVVAALLHDTVEDTGFSLAHVKAMFGETVAFLVMKATNLEDRIRRINLEDYENLHRLIYYEDPRAVLVKLADRLHNMRTITGHPSLAKQKIIADETFIFFVPLAMKLGLKKLEEELSKLSLEVLGKSENQQ